MRAVGRTGREGQAARAQPDVPAGRAASASLPDGREKELIDALGLTNVQKLEDILRYNTFVSLGRDPLVKLAREVRKNSLVPQPVEEEGFAETVSYVALQALLNGMAVYVSTQVLDGQNDPTSGVLFLWALMSSQPGFTDRLKMITAAAMDGRSMTLHEIKQKPLWTHATLRSVLLLHNSSSSKHATKRGQQKKTGRANWKLLLLRLSAARALDRRRCGPAWTAKCLRPAGNLRCRDRVRGRRR